MDKASSTTIIDTLNGLLNAQKDALVKIENLNHANPLDKALEVGRVSGYISLMEETVVETNKFFDSSKNVSEYCVKQINRIDALEKTLTEERSKIPWSNQTTLNESQMTTKGTINGKIVALGDISTLIRKVSSELARVGEIEREAQKS